MGEAGEASEGLVQLEKAFAFVDAGVKYQLPELLRVKGQLLLRRDEHDDTAEDWFRRALKMAHDEGTKSLELRAALSLARLYRARGCESDARDVLFPVYNWFTEAFDTRDLIEVKNFLDQQR